MSMSTLYVAKTLAALRAQAELSKENGALVFAANESKRLGHKPKRFDGGIRLDVGRGARLAFFSDGTIEQTALLLAIVNSVGAKPPVPLRFVFCAGGRSSETADDMDGVAETYAFKFVSDIDDGTIGYCYGAACEGRAEFVVDFAKDTASPDNIAKAAEYVALAGKTAASVDTALDAKISSDGRTQFVMRYFDTAKSEHVIMTVERAALAADDKFGTEHDFVASSVCPPVINHALAVDKVRYAAGEKAVEVKPSKDCDRFSEILSRTSGCLIFIGAGKDFDVSIAAAAELVRKLIYEHTI